MKKIVAIILASVFVLGLGFAPVQKLIAEKPPIGGAPELLAEKPPIGGAPVFDAIEVAYDVVTMEKPPIGG